MTACLLLAALLLSACGAAAHPEEDTLAPPAIQMVVTPAPTVTPPPTPEPPRASLRITEVMAKNLATLRDEDGDFSDWIEIENFGKTEVELEGFRLTDRENRIYRCVYCEAKKSNHCCLIYLQELPCLEGNALAYYLILV